MQIFCGVFFFRRRKKCELCGKTSPRHLSQKKKVFIPGGKEEEDATGGGGGGGGGGSRNSLLARFACGRRADYLARAFLSLSLVFRAVNFQEVVILAKCSTCRLHLQHTEGEGGENISPNSRSLALLKNRKKSQHLCLLPYLFSPFSSSFPLMRNSHSFSQFPPPPKKNCRLAPELQEKERERSFFFGFVVYGK